MAIPIDDEKIFKIYQEGKLKSMAMGAAMGAASLMGNPNTTMADTTYNDAYASENMHVLNSDTFVDLWIEYYQTDGKERGRDKVIEAKKKLSDGVNIPSNAMDAVNTAVYIFGGDEGVSPNVLSDLLVYTGEVESLYKTRKQMGDGPARGYWQVEPQTAIDLLINSKAYFGGKFKKRFGDRANFLLTKVKQDNSQTREIVGDMISKDDELAAAFAAAKWVSVSKKAGLTNIRNN
jgi:hypothetical protein